jgi:hypothetical protein
MPHENLAAVGLPGKQPTVAIGAGIDLFVDGLHLALLVTIYKSWSLID